MFPNSNKKVTFSSALDLIYEDESMSEDLKLARISDFLTRQADRLRMERLLNPILAPAHRDKMRRVVELSQQWLERRQLTMDSRILQLMQKWKKLLPCVSWEYARAEPEEDPSIRGSSGAGSGSLATTESSDLSDPSMEPWREIVDFVKTKVPEHSFLLCETLHPEGFILKFRDDIYTLQLLDALFSYFFHRNCHQIKHIHVTSEQVLISFVETRFTKNMTV